MELGRQETTEQVAQSAKQTVEQAPDTAEYHRNEIKYRVDISVHGLKHGLYSFEFLDWI